jgi:HEPN domain-containing protein
MPPPEQLEEVHAWLVKASHDLRAARHLSKIEPPLLDVAVYHCQQAMEKAIKAYLTLVGSPFAKTHALVVLVEQASEHDREFELLLDHAENLSPFAWRFRYPGEVLEPDAAEAHKAVELAREALDFGLRRTPEEAHPGPTEEESGPNKEQV